MEFGVVVALASHHLGNGAGIAFGAGVEKNAVGALQGEGIGAEFGDAQGGILRGHAEDQCLLLLARVAVEPLGDADVERRDRLHPLHPHRLREPRPRDVQLLPQVEVAAAHQHQLAIDALDRPLLAVVEAARQPQLEEHQHIGEAHPGDRRRQPHRPVDRLAPGQRCASQWGQSVQRGHRQLSAHSAATSRSARGAAARSAARVAAAAAASAPV